MKHPTQASAAGRAGRSTTMIPHACVWGTAATPSMGDRGGGWTWRQRSGILRRRDWCSRRRAGS